MARRLPPLIALVAIVLLALPAAAFAYTARVVTPDNGLVAAATEVHVRISPEFGDPSVRGLQVRLPGSDELHPTECVEGCEGPSRDAVFAFEFDPRTGAPFGTASLPNGQFTFEGVVSRSIGGDRSAGELTVTLRVPGSAVGGLAGTVRDDAVRLAWSRAPEPDIVSYRIERCAGTCDAEGDWESATHVQPSASSHTERPGVGVHSYRVVTIRSSGSDGDGSIETVSAPITAEVLAPDTEDADPDGEPEGAGEGDEDVDGTPDSEEQDADGSDEPRSVDAPDLAEDDEPAASQTPSSRGPRTSRAPSVAVDRGGTGIPDVPAVGDVFENELDYSLDGTQVAPADDDEAQQADEVVLSAPGRSSGSFLGRMTDPNRVAVPIAGGLLMTAIGLHLWRWLRIPLS